MNKFKFNSKGFSLVELIVVISIISILLAIVAFNFIRYIEKSKEKVCNINCLQIERMYNLHLQTEGIDHSDILFDSFLNDYNQTICPSHGEITYKDGKVKCSIHINEESTESEDEDDDDESVPFL